jgi:hypothetical protein
LDYAPRSDRGGIGRILISIAKTVVYVVISALLGAFIGSFISRPIYTAWGYLTAQPMGSASARPAVLPKQWQLQQIVPTALARARRVYPDGQSLPSSLSIALRHARIRNQANARRGEKS